MRTLILLCCICISVAHQAHASDRAIVKVGGYAFPPFVDMSSGSPAGITLDLINALNGCQHTYRFEFTLTSPKRRYHDFKKGTYDIIFFEDILWGWETHPVDASKVFLTGGDVYITKAVPGRDQSYFDVLEGKTKSGILGYHYGFADFDASPKILGRKHKMRLYTNHRLLIESAASGQADMAVTPVCYLSYYLKNNPAYISRLLVSERYDQIYKHTALVRKGTRPDVNEINRLLDALKENGALDSLWGKYGILNPDHHRD